MRGWIRACFSRDTLCRRGMTLIELMVILAVLSLLTTAVVLTVRMILDHTPGKQRRVARDFKALHEALRLHVETTGRLPAPDAGLGALVEQGLIEKLPQDPWGRDYRYLLLGEEAVLVSLGADGAPGGEGLDWDLSSRDLDVESAR
ncbi:MAG: prepilin-type N-terminal cleavage/methylation domain-containing protein [Myxococcaceae bacterium]|nr:MAG: prepilin-type N-terminal cleavage/methylation domain-containing protein [Myxococcaceae bacterium]